MNRPALPRTASVERRNDQWLVIYASAIVGRFTAKYKAVEYAAHYNRAADDESLGVGHIWTNMACPAYRTLDPTDCECAS